MIFIVFVFQFIGCFPFFEASGEMGCRECPRASVDCQKNEEVAHLFFKDITENKYSDAYSLLSEKYRDSISAEIFKSKIVGIVPLLLKEREICFTQWAIVSEDCKSEEFIPPCAIKYYGFYIKYRDKGAQKSAKKLKMVLLEMQRGKKIEINNIRIEDYHP